VWEAPGFYATYIVCVARPRPSCSFPACRSSWSSSACKFSRADFAFGHHLLQLLLNDRELLGERWVNRPWNNVINWTIIAVLFALSLLLAAQVMLPNLFN